jgi:hypothetical protein
MSTSIGSQQFNVSIGGNVTGTLANGTNITQVQNVSTPAETADSPIQHLPADQQERLRRLRQQILHRFDESELRTLSFELGILYDDLKGDTRQDKVGELLRHFVRHGRLDELVSALTAERPLVDWN